MVGAVADEDVGVVVGHSPPLGLPPQLRKFLEPRRSAVVAESEDFVFLPGEDVVYLVLWVVDGPFQKVLSGEDIGFVGRG